MNRLASAGAVVCLVAHVSVARVNAQTPTPAHPAPFVPVAIGAGSSIGLPGSANMVRVVVETGPHVRIAVDVGRVRDGDVPDAVSLAFVANGGRGAAR